MRPRAAFFTLLTSFAGVALLAVIGGGSPADGTAQATRPAATQPTTSVATRATSSPPAAQPPTSAPISTTASAPASRPRGPVQFQPGVWIDWNERAVAAAGRVVLNEGPLELIACFHSKEHESVVKFDCKALHLFMALGLSGLTPGHPPRWNDATSGYEPAEGDLVDVWIEYDVAGTTKREHPFAWLREMEFDRNPLPRPLVFAGSKLLDADTIASDMNGVGISIVDQAESLICLTRQTDLSGSMRRMPR